MWSHVPAKNRLNRKTKNIRLFGIQSSDYHPAKFWIQTDKTVKIIPTILAKNPWNTPFPCAMLRWHFTVSLATMLRWHFTVSLSTTTLQKGGGRKWCENVQSVSRFVSKIVDSSFRRKADPACNGVQCSPPYRCSPVWWFCTTWVTTCKRPFLLPYKGNYHSFKTFHRFWLAQSPPANSS